MARIIIITPIALYLVCVLGFFVYMTFEVGPFGGALVADWLLVRGPVRRELHSVMVDEVLLSRFWMQRPHLQKLVDINAEKCLIEPLPGKDGYTESEEVKLLKREVGLRSIVAGGELWIPSSQKTQFQEDKNSMINALGHARELAWSGYKLGGKPPDMQVFRDFDFQLKKMECRFHALKFVAEASEAHSLVKGWVNFPVEPKIVNGEIYFPSLSDAGGPLEKYKMLPSLDAVTWLLWPPKGCFYRRIEARWFMYVCVNQ